MTVTTCMIALGVLALVLLLSETVLSVLKLDRVHVGGALWTAGIVALVAGTYWADRHGWPTTWTHVAALALAGLLSAAWFNDPRPAPPAHATYAKAAEDRDATPVRTASST